jgi:ketosteroid isomerase-like protein
VSDGLDRLKAAYEAFKTQDIPTLMAAFDEDIEWTCPDALPFGGTYRGHDGVGSFFGQLGNSWQEISIEPEEFIEAGNVIVVPVQTRGRGAGGALESRNLHLWRMRDDKAVSFREYPDTARVLQALGQPVPASA